MDASQGCSNCPVGREAPGGAEVVGEVLMQEEEDYVAVSNYYASAEGGRGDGEREEMKMGGIEVKHG